ncbi:MAG: flagellar basal body protein [Actinomycetota bacterium]|nr:flagellar basal body protein [Actinomycetota bacterium]
MLDLAMRAIQASLDGLAARQRITAENIANVDTPGYLAGRISFENSLAEAIKDGDPTASGINPWHSLDPTRMNGNNVNVDDENVSLVETGLRFELAVESMNNKFRILRDSIRRDT